MGFKLDKPFSRMRAAVASISTLASTGSLGFVAQSKKSAAAAACTKGFLLAKQRMSCLESHSATQDPSIMQQSRSKLKRLSPTY
ncbi:hypothetical protein LZ190_08660 [Rhodovulum sulfidophilum]|nr:hypothetical protein [Rhodovulum sulfidophilum]